LNRFGLMRKGMKDDNLEQTKARMVHVRLPEGLHKRLRIRAAESDATLQDWVAMAIRNELDRQDQEKGKGSE
jgi:predicted HicB family RNase H-like nuclease